MYHELFGECLHTLGLVTRLADVTLLASSYSTDALAERRRECLPRQCKCGPETSCQSCLRNYENQFCHEKLKRGLVVDFLTSLIGE
jgi:hypothetical protein